MRKTRRPQAHLTQFMPATALTQKVRFRYSHVGIFYFWMIVTPAHRFHIANDFEPWGVGGDNKGGITRLWDFRIGIRSSNNNGEIGALRARGKPFVTINHPLIAFLNGTGLNERRI